VRRAPAEERLCLRALRFGLYAARTRPRYGLPAMLGADQSPGEVLPSLWGAHRARTVAQTDGQCRVSRLRDLAAARASSPGRTCHQRVGMSKLRGVMDSARPVRSAARPR